MRKIYYCTECKRLCENDEVCKYCGSNYLKKIVQGTSVNIIGTKRKGSVLKFDDSKIYLILKDEGNNKFIKDFQIEEIRKVL